MEPILEIVIPTYNREDYLRECISSIKLKTIERGCSLSFTVVDNGTNSNTIENLVTTNSGRYIRNHANFGANMSVIRCFAIANAHYVHIIGDDDLILPEYNNIFKSLGNDMPDYLLLAEPCLHNILDSQVTMYDVMIEISRNPVLLGSFSHITSLIYKKSLFDFGSALKQVDTFYPFLWSLFSPIFDGTRDPRHISVSVINGSSVIHASGIKPTTNTSLRPSAVDVSDSFSREDLERGFQSTLFTIWAKIFQFTCGEFLDLDHLKHIYCKKIDQTFQGSYDYLLSVIEFERGFVK